MIDLRKIAPPDDDDEDLVGGIDERDELDRLLDEEPLVAVNSKGKPTIGPNAAGNPQSKRVVAPRNTIPAKGVYVEFYNKAGVKIIGPGVLYYVVKQDGKLHYKEASKARELTPQELEEWELTQ